MLLMSKPSYVTNQGNKKESVIKTPLEESSKIILPPLHIKFDEELSRSVLQSIERNVSNGT